jgi:hypothetical protein
MPLPGEDLTTYEGWAKFVARHGGLAGEATKISPDKEGGRLTGPAVQDPFYHYELGDGTTIDVNGAGAVKNLDEKVSKATPDQLQTVIDPRTNKPIAMIGQGVSVNLPKETSWQDNAKWMDQPDGSKRWQALNPDTNLMQDVGGVAPVPATAKSTPAPEMQKVNGTWMQRPAGSSDPNAWVNAGLPTEVDKTAAATPTFREFEGKTYQWLPDATKPGGGSFKLAEGFAEGAHPPSDFIEGGYKVHKVWNEGTKKYEVDPSVTPEAWSPETQAAAAKLAGQPKQGDTRDNIVGGYKVKQLYSGGDWTTTSIGERATPQEIQQLTAGTEQPYIVQTGAQGGITTSDNPNYQGPKAPTTRGELAQRTALLQSQMMQMKDKIAADKSIPADQQAARFSTWYDQHVAPQVDALGQQQQAIIQDETQKALELQQKNLTSASTAMQGLMPYRVGPGYGQALEGIVQHTMNTRFPGETGPPTDLGTGWSTFKAPNLDQQIQSLASAQPTVAPGMDFQSMLGRNQWTPGGTPPPDAGGGTPPTTAGQIPQHPVYPGLAQGTGPVPPGQSSYTIPGLNPSMMPGGLGLADFRASLPPPPELAMASGSGPLPYNPAVFSGLIPLLPGANPQQFRNPYEWPYGGGGGGNSGFTAGP